jgi:predicted Zn-ribbon and HTH transcriptional regulator
MTECHNCGYEWEYSGEMKQATCPSCGRKTPVE